MGVHFIAGLRMVIFKILPYNPQTILFINSHSSEILNAIFVKINSDYHRCYQSVLYGIEILNYAGTSLYQNFRTNA